MNHSTRRLITLLALAACTLGACRKTTKTSSAGGGSSSQSVFLVKGAIR